MLQTNNVYKIDYPALYLIFDHELAMLAIL